MPAGGGPRSACWLGPSGIWRPIASENCCTQTGDRRTPTRLRYIAGFDSGHRPARATSRGSVRVARPILGYRPDEMIGHSATEFICPDDLESTRNEMRLARRGRITRNFETRYLHKDGQCSDARLDGRLVGTCAATFLRRPRYDRAETRRRQVREQRTLLDAALQNMSQGLCMFDANGCVVLIQRALQGLIGRFRPNSCRVFHCSISSGIAAHGRFCRRPREILR